MAAPTPHRARRTHEIDEMTLRPVCESVGGLRAAAQAAPLCNAAPRSTDAGIQSLPMPPRSLRALSFFGKRFTACLCHWAIPSPPSSGWCDPAARGCAPLCTFVRPLPPSFSGSVGAVRLCNQRGMEESESVHQKPSLTLWNLTHTKESLQGEDIPRLWSDHVPNRCVAHSLRVCHGLAVPNDPPRSSPSGAECAARRPCSYLCHRHLSVGAADTYAYIPGYPSGVMPTNTRHVPLVLSACGQS